VRSGSTGFVGLLDENKAVDAVMQEEVGTYQTGVGRDERESRVGREEGESAGGRGSRQGGAAREGAEVEKILEAKVARRRKRGGDGAEVRSHREGAEGDVGRKGRREETVELLDEVAQRKERDLNHRAIRKEERLAHFVEAVTETTATRRRAKERTPSVTSGTAEEEGGVGSVGRRGVPRGKREGGKGERVRSSKDKAVVAIVNNETDGGGEGGRRMFVRKGEGRKRGAGDGEGEVNEASRG